MECPKCRGESMVPCEACGGDGFISYGSELEESVECTHCGGTTKMDCPRCNGTGEV